MRLGGSVLTLISQRQFPQPALVLVSEEQPLQELLPRHLAETPATFGITVRLSAKLIVNLVGQAPQPGFPNYCNEFPNWGGGGGALVGGISTICRQFR